MIKDVFTIPEIADICRLSRQTVHNWIKKGYLKGFRPAKNAVWKVTRKELVSHMKEHDIPIEFLKDEKIKILIVDDEDYAAELMKELLRDEKGYCIDSAKSGFSAGSKLEIFRPDVVILDIFLGDIDGRELFKHINEHPELNQIKVIGISGKLGNKEIQQLYDLGFKAFLHKPFKKKDLIETISKVIEN